MTLPNMPAHPASREFLRVGGGYGVSAEGQSPAGGLDVDDAGNLATDGDAVVDGTLDAGDDLTVAADAFFVDASNKRAGIGTASPAQKLHVHTASTGSTRIRLANTDGYIDLIFTADSFQVLDESGATMMRWGSGNEIVAYKNLRPNVDNTFDLGASLTRWATVYGVDADFSGDGEFQGGDIAAGTYAGNRGMLEARYGSGGNAPGCLKLYSPNGTPHYIFAEDDGTLKVHNALPTQNADGTVVGLQT